MDEAAAVRTGESLDWQQLSDYLRAHLPNLIGQHPMTVAQFHGGHANLTYLLRFGDTELVLRRPPFGKIAPGAHDMAREYRVLSGLYIYFPRAPRAYLYCEDTSIIGAAFVIMERRNGLVVRKRLPDCFAGYLGAEARLSSALLRAAADLHTIPDAQQIFPDLGQAEGYLQRQLTGWKKRWLLAKTEENPTMDSLLQVLEKNIPSSQYTAIVHNDIKLDNCQFQPNNPDEVTAMFDWDMATIGDPLLDFATTLSYWPDPALKAYDFLPVSLQGKWPPKAFLRHQYADFTGFSLAELPWYEALAFVRVAIIAQQLYRRYHDGATQDRRMASLGQAAKVMISMGQKALE